MRIWWFEHPHQQNPGIATACNYQLRLSFDVTTMSVYHVNFMLNQPQLDLLVYNHGFMQDCWLCGNWSDLWIYFYPRIGWEVNKFYTTLLLTPNFVVFEKGSRHRISFSLGSYKSLGLIPPTSGVGWTTMCIVRDPISFVPVKTSSRTGVRC